MQLTRLIILGVLILLFVSGCGSENGETSESGSSAESEDNKQETVEDNKVQDEQTRVYETDKGEVTIPENPERVAVAVQDYVGYVLALGIEPVGAAGWVFDVPYYEEDLENTEAIGDKESVSVEKMVEVNPDIIFTYMEDSYDQLSQIAQTVYIPFGSYNYRDLLLEMGDILNREEEAEDWLDSFDETVAAKKKELFDHIGEDETVALIELSEKDVFLYGDSYGRGGEILYNELGLNAPEPVEEIAFEEGWAKISMETIPEYLGDADHIFLGVRGESVGEGDGGQRKDELESLDVWNSLKAVENGNVYEYDVDTYYFSDPLALDTQLDEIVDALIEK